MSNLYRKSSIEKLSSPEQLDKAIRITSSFSWLVIIGVFIIVVIVSVWAFIGRLPETQTVSGVIVDKSDVYAVYSNKTGTVVDVKKRSGDKVAAGEVIAVAKASNGSNFEIKANESGIMTDILLNDDMKVYSGNEIARMTPNIADENLIVCYVPISVGEQIKKDMEVKVYPISVDSQKYGHMEATVEQVGEHAVSASNMQYILGNDNMLSDQFLQQGPVVSVVCRIKTDKSTTSGYYWTNTDGKDVRVPNGTLISAKVITKSEAPIKKLFKSFGN